MAKQQMYSYSKETLFSFAALPICQIRPDGIDPALWRDSTTLDVVEESIAIPVVPSARGLVRRDSDLGGYSKSPVDDIPEWRRPGGGGALLQPTTRRKPYEEEPVGNAFSSSYPPRPTMSWNDTNGPSRPAFDRPGPGPNGPPGRWDRFGDRDRERGRLPHDWDGDEPGPIATGEAFQRSWVERDGLLGSGSRGPPLGLPRLGRPSDTYQPPRPIIKPPMYGRREDTDTVNDETFGPSEVSNEERAEQERKRRESFEMMRKEQHRHLQGQKQPLPKTENSSVLRKHDENCLWDNLPQESPPNSPIGKITVIPAPTTPRPAIPPGFSKVAQQRLNLKQATPQQEDDAQGANGTVTKSGLIWESTPMNKSEAGNETDETSAAKSGTGAAIKDSTVATKETSIESETVITKIVVTETVGATASNGILSSVGSINEKMLKESSELWSFNLEDGNDFEVLKETMSTEEVVSIRKESLLDKLFGNAAPGLSSDGPPAVDYLGVGLPRASEEDTWSEIDPKMPKFAQWFHSEGEKSIIDTITVSSTNIMSLFSKSEKSNITTKSPSVEKGVQENGGIGPIRKPSRSIIPMPAGPSLEDIEKGMTTFAEETKTSKSTDLLDGCPSKPNLSQERPPALPPVFMTCEDIEQKLLAEAVGSDSYSVLPVVSVVETPPTDATSASQHLLALLQRRPSVPETGLSNGATEVEAISQETDNERLWKKPESNNHQVKDVRTLETLFGKAFMNELRAPEPQVPVNKYFAGGFSSHKNEATVTPFGLQSENKHNAKAGVNETEDIHSWFGNSSPGWNSMWPDSNEVEAGAQKNAREFYFSEPQQSQPATPEREDKLSRMPSAPPITQLWGNSEFDPSLDQFSMDFMNGATSNVGGAAFKSSLSEGLLDTNNVKSGNLINSRGPEVIGREESLPLGVASKNRLLPTGEKLILLTRTSEVNATGVSPVLSPKKLYPSKSFPDNMGKVKEKPLNGVARNLGQGSGPQFKVAAGVAGFNTFSPEGPSQQNFNTMFRPQSPPGLPMQHFGAPPLPSLPHQQPSHGPSGSPFPHPTFRPQQQAPAFNNGGLDFPFDGSGPRPFQASGQVHFQPPSHSFHGPMGHQPHQFLGQPQMMQRSPFFPGIVMQEHESAKQQLPAGVGSLHVPTGPHVHGQVHLNHGPVGLLNPFNSEFARAGGGKGHASGGHSGGAVERWFEGNRSGLSGPASIQSPLLAMEADLNMRF